eukprot:scaffold26921_cov105-Isochrysis_galbana.AAC.3
MLGPAVRSAWHARSLSNGQIVHIDGRHAYRPLACLPRSAQAPWWCAELLSILIPAPCFPRSAAVRRYGASPVVASQVPCACREQELQPNPESEPSKHAGSGIRRRMSFAPRLGAWHGGAMLQ